MEDTRNLIDQSERVVLCFDRDHTVSVNPHPERAAVPIGWVQYWAHETDIPVWASGNQHLKSECEIPGLSEAEFLWEEYLCNPQYEFENSEFENFIKPTRRDGLRLIQDLYEQTFPETDFRFIVVDDVDVSDLAAEGPWTHYFPWDFRAAVEAGALRDSRGITEPPEDAYTNNGIPFNSTSQPDFDIERRTCDEIRGELRGSDHLDAPQ